MDIDALEEKHLARLLQHDLPAIISPSFVQRTCGIGYNNALHVLARGVSEGRLEPDPATGNYRARR